MSSELNSFLATHRTPGESSVGEVFLALCRETGVPPTPQNEALCERLLTAAGLLINGTVTRRVRGRDRPPKATPHHKFDNRMDALLN